MRREDVSNPTINTDSTLLAAINEAEDGRKVASSDIQKRFKP
jgi:hypothetical protein